MMTNTLGPHEFQKNFILNHQNDFIILTVKKCVHGCVDGVCGGGVNGTALCQMGRDRVTH